MQYVARFFAPLLALLGHACGPVDGVDLAGAEQAQLVPIGSTWGLYELSLGNHIPLARVLVMGDDALESYEPKTEYWFVDTAQLGALGQKPLTITRKGGQGAPPALEGKQEFSLPRDVPWEAPDTEVACKELPRKWRAGPKGALYGEDGISLSLEADAEGLVRLVWCQSTRDKPTNLAPEGTLAPLKRMTARKGEKLYCIDQLVP